MLGIHFVHRLGGQKAHDYHVTEHAAARIRAPIYTDSGSVPGYACQQGWLCRMKSSCILKQMVITANVEKCTKLFDKEIYKIHWNEIM